VQRVGLARAEGDERVVLLTPPLSWKSKAKEEPESVSVPVPGSHTRIPFRLSVTGSRNPAARGARVHLDSSVD